MGDGKGVRAGWAESGAMGAGAESIPGRDSCLWTGACEKLQDNNSNQAAFKSRPFQLLTFHLFIMRIKR